MGKEQQFLMIVQTMFLANAINQTIEPEEAKGNRHLISASGAFMFMDDAIYASERIPKKLSASEAAHDFATHWLDGERTQTPQWFHRDFGS